MAPDPTPAFEAAFRRGERERTEAAWRIAARLGELKAALEATGLGLTVEHTDYDGLFVRLPRGAEHRSGPGWWAYLLVGTQPTGLSYTVQGGFGPKNDPDGLRDRLPELTVETVDAGLAALETYLERGMYYLGSLKH